MSAFRELQNADLGKVEEFGAGKGGRTVSTQVMIVIYNASEES